MTASALFDVIDDAIAAPGTRALETLVSSAGLVAGAPVAELAAGRPLALPDDSISWAAVELFGNQLAVLHTAPFSRVARSLGEGVVAVCAAFDRGARVVAVTLPDGASVTLIATAMAGQVPAVWRVVVPAAGDRDGMPALIGDTAELVARLSNAV